MNNIQRRSHSNTIVGLVGMVFARLVSPLLSFLIIVLVARMWGQEMFGRYNTVWVWLILFKGSLKRLAKSPKNDISPVWIPLGN